MKEQTKMSQPSAFRTLYTMVLNWVAAGAITGVFMGASLGYTHP